MLVPTDDQESSVPPERRLRVLLVDDNVDSSELLALILKRAGHEIRMAADAASALVEVESFHPELAIVDIGLPDMDGYELAQRIREIATCKLIALSGYAADTARVDSTVTYFDHHLLKPLDYGALARVMETLR